MLNIVIPMAGLGSRFANAGYLDPKPLIRVHDVPMIQVVIENLRPSRHHRFIFICQDAHLKAFGLRPLLHAWAPGSLTIGIDGLTEGAACTVLKARTYINTDEPLMIANCDQYVDVSIDEYLSEMDVRKLDGFIMTMEASDPKWSYAGLDQEQLVTRVVEKEVISNEATVGIYNYRRGRDFVAAADAMIHENLRVNGEFYVAPAYEKLIEGGYRVGIRNIGREANGMYGLGVPADLELFRELEVSKRAVERLA